MCAIEKLNLSARRLTVPPGWQGRMTQILIQENKETIIRFGKDGNFKNTVPKININGLDGNRRGHAYYME